MLERPHEKLHPSSRKDHPKGCRNHNLDLSNSGPPGNTTSPSTQTSKNLSHVPCKFFKQGICLAGRSCPFSHDLDSPTGADKLPCKYFQKGNCKFGVKCALAHYFPDGTRINKTLLSRKRSSNRSEISTHLASETAAAAASDRAISANTSNCRTSPGPCLALADPIDISPGTRYARTVSWSSMPGTVRTARLGIYFDLHAAPVDAYGAGDWLGRLSFHISPTLITNNTLYAGFHQSPERLTVFEKYPYEMSPFNAGHVDRNAFKLGFGDMSAMGRKPASAVSLASTDPGTAVSSSPLYVFGQFVDDAVADDARDDEEPFFEDYVPASLGNLILTPQEQQRRYSRSQSGILLMRPHVSKAPDCKGWPMVAEQNDSVFLMD
ncbi:hypothetical protein METBISCDRAFT_22639 [Metschnikowia bicuspidata]|uniref:C3H1-type domain-containing protein n=1 Tax=Metschnikowia bicuspidata TaxID=27322 RepID=A0A4P9ZEH9_9ASCO|nr:hypothetical protein METBISCDRAFT_22639 [Metschnikowia bicuspidata]